LQGYPYESDEKRVSATLIVSGLVLMKVATPG